jgi:hypothetical protein
MRSQRLDLTDNERAILITVLRRLVDFNPQPLSPQIQALKAIHPRTAGAAETTTHTRYCGHRVSPPRRRSKALNLLRLRRTELLAHRRLPDFGSRAAAASTLITQSGLTRVARRLRRWRPEGGR